MGGAELVSSTCRKGMSIHWNHPSWIWARAYGYYMFIYKCMFVSIVQCMSVKYSKHMICTGRHCISMYMYTQRAYIRMILCSYPPRRKLALHPGFLPSSAILLARLMLLAGEFSSDPGFRKDICRRGDAKTCNVSLRNTNNLNTSPAFSKSIQSENLSQ